MPRYFFLIQALFKAHSPLPNLCPSVGSFWPPPLSLPDPVDPAEVQYASEVERSLYENTETQVRTCKWVCMYVPDVCSCANCSWTAVWVCSNGGRADKLCWEWSDWEETQWCTRSVTEAVVPCTCTYSWGHNCQSNNPKEESKNNLVWGY